MTQNLYRIIDQYTMKDFEAVAKRQFDLENKAREFKLDVPGLEERKNNPRLQDGQFVLN